LSQNLGEPKSKTDFDLKFGVYKPLTELTDKRLAHSSVQFSYVAPYAPLKSFNV